MSSDDSILIDMNGLIYLVQMSILEKIFDEFADVFTSDMVQSKEMKNPSWDLCRKLGLQILELDSKQVERAESIIMDHTNMSIIDAELIVLSQDLEITLLTEDDAMQKYLKKCGLPFTTIPDVIERLINHGHITKERGKACFILLRDVLLQKRYDYSTYFKKYGW